MDSERLAMSEVVDEMFVRSEEMVGRTGKQVLCLVQVRHVRVGERMLLLLPGFDKISEKLEKEIDAHLSLLFELNFTGVTSFL